MTLSSGVNLIWTNKVKFHQLKNIKVTTSIVRKFKTLLKATNNNWDYQWSKNNFQKITFQSKVKIIILRSQINNQMPIKLLIKFIIKNQWILIKKLSFNRKTKNHIHLTKLDRLGSSIRKIFWPISEIQFKARANLN